MAVVELGRGHGGIRSAYSVGVELPWVYARNVSHHFTHYTDASDAASKTACEQALEFRVANSIFNIGIAHVDDADALTACAILKAKSEGSRIINSDLIQAVSLYDRIGPSAEQQLYEPQDSVQTITTSNGRAGYAEALSAILHLSDDPRSGRDLDWKVSYIQSILTGNGSSVEINQLAYERQRLMEEARSTGEFINLSDIGLILAIGNHSHTLEAAHVLGDTIILVQPPVQQHHRRLTLQRWSRHIPTSIEAVHAAIRNYMPSEPDWKRVTQNTIVSAKDEDSMVPVKRLVELTSRLRKSDVPYTEVLASLTDNEWERVEAASGLVV